MKDILVKILEELYTMQADIKENWARGTYTHQTVEGTIQANSEALGYIKATNELATYIETVLEEISKDDIFGSA